MINVLTEIALSNKLTRGASFSPTNFLFIIIEKGQIRIEENESNIDYSRGNIVTLLPNRLYKIQSYSDNLKVYFISADRSKLNKKTAFVFNQYEMLKALHINQSNLQSLQEDALKNLLVLCSQLHFYSQNESTISFSQHIKLALFTSMVYIIASDFLKDNTNKNGVFENNRKEEITMKFIQQVRENFTKEKELKFYADRLSISVKYLSNTVRELTHQPPSQIIVDALLNKAKILLLNSKKPIKEIARQLNYSDQYSFGKFFKKHTGASPSYFRKVNTLMDSVNI